MDGAPAPSAERLLGRYVLCDEIASGGMAAVHLGRLVGPVGFARTVAIKRLHPQFAKDPQFVTMFLDEARLAARVRHPNVVPTLDVVAQDGELFLVMEYVHGESLSHLLRVLRLAGKRVPLPVAATLMSGVLQGLHAAHEAKNEHGVPLGIVHRDVSPQNVMVGTDGVARVLDFGVAKAVDQSHTTREGQLKGKLPYMAPEHVRADPITRRTDVFAASVVLWEVLTGQRLFRGETAASLLAQIVEAGAPPPSSIASGISAELDAVVLRGLARDPELRFPTALDMAKALEKAAGSLASQRDVGEWVASVAGERLDQRARRVAEVESVSTGGVVAPPAPRSQPGPAAPSRPSTETAAAAPPAARTPVPAEPAVSSQVSSLVVAESLLPNQTRPRRGNVLVLGVLGAIVGCVGAWIVATWSAPRAGVGAATTTAPSADTAAASASPTAAASADAPSGPAAPAAAATADATSAPAASTSSAAPRAKASAPSSAPKAGAAPAAHPATTATSKPAPLPLHGRE